MSTLSMEISYYGQNKTENDGERLNDYVLVVIMIMSESFASYKWIMSMEVSWMARKRKKTGA